GVLTSKSRIERKSNFTIQCERPGEVRGDDVYFAPDVISLGTTQGMSYTIDLSRETIYGPALQSEVAETIRRLEGELARLRPYEGATLKLFPYHAISGPNGNGGLKGQLWSWGDAGQAQAARDSKARREYCPNAILDTSV